jgi:hypothetical protein
MLMHVLLLIVFASLDSFSSSHKVDKGNEKEISISCYSGGNIFFADSFKGNFTITKNTIVYIKEKTKITTKGDCLITETEE